MCTIDWILSREESFRYQMLSRLKSDCDYYLGYGNRNHKNLWSGDEREQIEIMKAIWNSFSLEEKPEWLTLEKIEKYENEML